MYRMKTDELVRLRDRLRRHLTFIPFFEALDIEPEQVSYFMRRGVDSGRRLRPRTIKARERRWGYYKRPRRSSGGVEASRPYLVWTGNTLDHTTKKKGRTSIRSGFLTIQHDLERRVVNYWDVRALDDYVGRAADVYFQGVIDGRRLPQTLRVRASS